MRGWMEWAASFSYLCWSLSVWGWGVLAGGVLVDRVFRSLVVGGSFV